MGIFDNQADAPDAITGSIEIRGLLKRLLKERNLLAISMEGYSGQISSTLLAIDEPPGYLKLDELVPIEAHRKLKKGLRLAVTSRVNGIKLSSVLQVSSHGMEEGGGFILTPFPGWIRYFERRHAFRVPLLLTKPLLASLRTVEEEEEGSFELRGELMDLSVKGFGLRVPLRKATDRGPPRNGGRDGEEVPVAADSDYLLKILCENGNQEVDVRVVRSEPAEDRVGTYLHIGGYFINLIPSQKKNIERLVARIQRELLRRR